MLIALPTNKHNTAGEEFQVTEEFATELQRAYPAVNVRGKLNEIRAWCVSNPNKRKTLSGMPRFINAWLAKDQNRGGGGNGVPAQSAAPPVVSEDIYQRFASD